MHIIQQLTVFHFTTFILYLLLGAYCFRAPLSNTKTSVGMLLIFTSVWSLAKVIMHNPYTPPDLASAALKASFYFHITAFFLLLYVSILIRTSGKIAANYIYLISILLISAPVSVLLLRSDLYLLTKEAYGWATATNPGLLVFYNVFIFCTVVSSIIIMLSGIFSSDRTIRSIAKIMFICLLLAASAYFFLPQNNIIANSADMEMFPVYLAFFISISRFGLFDIASEISMNTVSRNIKEFLILTDSEGNILRSNAAFKEAAPERSSLPAIFEDIKVYTDLVIRAEGSSANVTGAAEIRLRDHKHMYVSISLTSLKRFGKTAAYLWVVSDITDRKALEYHLRVYSNMLEMQVEERTHELKLSNEELRKANEDLEHFSYASYHDLKEPVRQIIMHLQLLKMKGMFSNDEEELASYDLILSGAHRMNDLINAIRSYISLKKPALSGKFSLNDALNDARASTKLLIEEKKASISSQDLPVIYGSRSLYASVFSNLIANALKYNKNIPDIKITYDGAGSVTVSDNGIGIAPEYLEKIFGMFERLHNSSVYSGSGMGLAITKKIVELHGGTIRAQSDGISGASFTFTVKI